MPGVQARNFDSPDDTHTSDRRRVDTVRIAATTATRFTLEPGWRWSEHVGQTVGSERCELRHVGIVQSGRLRVTHEDGTELELAAGDAYVIEAGHDAWVVGHETFQCIEFESTVR